MTHTFSDYEAGVQQARDRFAEDWTVLFEQRLDSELLELFLIHFSAYGVRMTDPVEGWLRRASQRCGEIGMHDFAKALNGHASAEAGHQLMMIQDTKSLCAHWNESHSSKFDPDRLLSLPPKPGAARYIRIHETIIEGSTPFAQFALEYEIEMLPVKYGPRFLGYCARLLSPEITKCLSFITEHIELDVGHTKFNMRQMENLISQRPDAVPILIDAGSSILGAYAEFLRDCMSTAKSQLDRQPT